MFNPFLVERPARSLGPPGEASSLEVQLTSSVARPITADAVPDGRVMTDARARIRQRFSTLRDAFRTFDVDHDAFVDTEEVAKKLQEWGSPVSGADVAKMLAASGAKRTDFMDFDSFVRVFKGPDGPGQAHQFRPEVDLFETNGWLKAKDAAFSNARAAQKKAEDIAAIRAADKTVELSGDRGPERLVF